MYIYCPQLPPHHSRQEQEQVKNGENSLKDDSDLFDLTVIPPRTHSISFSDSIRKRHDSSLSHKHTERMTSPGISRQISVTSNVAMSRQVSVVGASNKIGSDDLFKKVMEKKFSPLALAESGQTVTQVKWYQSPKACKAFVIILAIAFVHVYYGLELTFGSFLTAFSVNSNVKMDSREGAQVTSIFWAAFTFWRLFTVFYITFTGPQLGIVINLVILAIGNILMVPFGYDNQWALYTGVVLIGVGISPLWGSMFGFLELYFPVTSKIASAMMTSAAIGEFIFPAILAKFMECQSIIFIYITLVCSIFTIGVFILIVLVCKYKLKETENEGITSTVH